jgi:hypothetical protein
VGFGSQKKYFPRLLDHLASFGFFLFPRNSLAPLGITNDASKFNYLPFWGGRAARLALWFLAQIVTRG